MGSYFDYDAFKFWVHTSHNVPGCKIGKEDSRTTLGGDQKPNFNCRRWQRHTMRPKITQKQLWLSLAALLLGLLGMWWLVGKLLESLSGLDNLVQAALIAVVGASITAITAIFVKKVEKKNEVEAQFREHKVELFNSFLQEFHLLSRAPEDERKSPEELTQYLRDFQIKLIFWGGPEVLISFLALRRGIGETKTLGDLGMMLQALGDMILAMRKDLGLSNRKIDKRSFAAHLILRHPDVFLAHLDANPDMTNDEYAEIEAQLNEVLGIQ